MGTFGIDLGTTYSCISKLDQNGNPVIISNIIDASDTLASAVYFENEDNVIVGDSAKSMAETDADKVVQFVKREIGKTDARTYEFDGKIYTPVNISAIILRRLKQMAEEQGETVDEVVITCPAYFGLGERNATRKAGEEAGMKVLDLINEPTAAALNYCARKFREERTILVYDLGGGTFDVTIVKMSLVTDENGEEVQKVKVISTGGNDRLGGKDWDDILYDHLFQVCCDENGLSPEDIDAETRQTLRGQIEKTKKKLSQAELAKVRISVNGTATVIPVTRELFESITADKVNQTMTYVEETIKKATKKYPDLEIDTVLLVGGSCKMPMIQKAVKDRFPGKVQFEDPDLAVAKGAAIYANMKVEEGKDPDPDPNPAPVPDPEPIHTDEPDKPHGPSTVTTTKTDVEDSTPRSFGPGVLNGSNEYIVDNLIKINTKMPADMEKTYYTPVANMTEIILRVFENMSEEDSVIPCVDRDGNPQDSPASDKVVKLGELIVKLPANTPKDSPIKVTFHVTGIGIHVKAMNQATGEEFETTISFDTEKVQGTADTNQLIVAGE